MNLSHLPTFPLLPGTWSTCHVECGSNLLQLSPVFLLPVLFRDPYLWVLSSEYITPLPSNSYGNTGVQLLASGTTRPQFESQLYLLVAV